MINTGSQVFVLYWLYWWICHIIVFLPTIVSFIVKLGFGIYHCSKYLSVIISFIVKAIFLFQLLPSNSIEFNSNSSDLFTLFESNQLNSSEFVSIKLTGDCCINNNNLLIEEPLLYDLSSLLFVFNSNNLRLVESHNLLLTNNLQFTGEAVAVTMEGYVCFIVLSFFFFVFIFLY